MPVDLSYGFPGELPKLGGGGGKQTEQLLQFFVNYAQGMSASKAAAAVGYSVKWGKQYSFKWLKRYKDYVTWLQAHFAQAAVKRIPVDTERALEELELIAMAKVAEYRVIEPRKGKPTARWKKLGELSDQQLQAVEPVGADGWKFRDRDGKLTELLRTMGLLNEKVILEHRHRHLHVHKDLSKIPLKQLEEAEARLEKLLLEPATEQDREGAIEGGVELPRLTNGNGEAH